MIRTIYTFFQLDLKRDFETPPYSQQIEVGRQAMLRCHPPRGEPEARVTHWLKNGQVVDPDLDSNFIQSATGHLLIQQARMSDSANYTCVASNDVIERISPPAVIGVYGEYFHFLLIGGVRPGIQPCDRSELSLFH